jgi:NitT/TauT family transport system permease protein
MKTIGEMPSGAMPSDASGGLTPLSEAVNPTRRVPWSAKIRRSLSIGALPALVLLIVLGAWAVISATLFSQKTFLLPGPAGVFSTMWDQRGLLASAGLVTFEESISGLGFAILIGGIVAIILSQNKVLERSLYPYAVVMQTVPIIAIAPMIVLWFGYQETSVVIIAVIIAVFPILNNTLLGLLSTPQNQVDLFLLHRVGRWRSFTKLRLPSAVPNIVAGLRISAGLSVVGAMVGEFVIGAGGSQGGLGVQIIFAEGELSTKLMFGEVIVATLLGFAFFLVISQLGRRFMRNWHESVMERET